MGFGGPNTEPTGGMHKCDIGRSLLPWLASHQHSSRRAQAARAPRRSSPWRRAGGRSPRHVDTRAALGSNTPPAAAS